jgi:hypothetical protein
LKGVHEDGEQLNDILPINNALLKSAYQAERRVGRGEPKSIFCDTR